MTMDKQYSTYEESTARAKRRVLQSLDLWRAEKAPDLSQEAFQSLKDFMTFETCRAVRDAYGIDPQCE